MYQILALGASNSKNSINRKFAQYAASQIKNSNIDLLDLNEFEMPIYSIDIENSSGIPDPAYHFMERIHSADGIIISFAEHNGHYTVAFKNIFDWISRIDRNIWKGKPMFLLSTAPGPRGAIRVLENAVIDMERKNGKVIAYFSLPFFRKNFSRDSGITDPDLAKQFLKSLSGFQKSLMQEANISSIRQS